MFHLRGSVPRIFIKLTARCQSFGGFPWNRLLFNGLQYTAHYPWSTPALRRKATFVSMLQTNQDKCEVCGTWELSPGLQGPRLLCKLVAEGKGIRECSLAVSQQCAVEKCLSQAGLSEIKVFGGCWAFFIFLVEWGCACCVWHNMRA